MKKIPTISWSDILTLKGPDAPTKTLFYANKYGEVVKVNSLINAFLITDPEFIEHILKKNVDNYSKNVIAYKRLGLLLGRGLLTSMGPSWQHRRRVLQPHFQQQALQKLSEVTINATQQMLDSWEWYAKHRQPINIVPRMLQLVLKISLKFLFDTTYPDKKIEQMVNWFGTGQRAMYHALSLNPWIPTPNNLRFRRVRKKIENISKSIIENRRKLDPSSWPADILSTLLNMQDPETDALLSEQMIWDEMITFMATGHETTGNALSLGWHSLAQNEAVLSCLRKDIQTILGNQLPSYAALPQLKYTKLVVNEILRLYPTVWSFARKAIQPDTFNDYHLPADAVVMICPYAMHRLAHYWDEPNRFMPERFEEQQITARPKMSYLPFGTGPHICVASAFSLFKMQLIITMMAQRYQFELLPESHNISLEPLISLRPMKPIRFMIR